MPDERRKTREPARSIVERQQAEASVRPHLPRLRRLQLKLARLRAEVKHRLRTGDRPVSHLEELNELKKLIERVRKDIGGDGAAPRTGRTADVERTLSNLATQVERVRGLIEGRRDVPWL